MWRCVWIEYDCNSREARDNLFHELEPLARHRWVEVGEAGRVAARFGYASDEAIAYRIGDG